MEGKKTLSGNTLLIGLSVFAVLSLTASLVFLFIIPIINHILSLKVCSDLHNGSYSRTMIGNGTSYPIWLSQFLRPLTHGDYFDAEIPLVEACWEGNYTAVCDILNNGADPNYSYEGYWTAIEATYASPIKDGNDFSQNNRLMIAKLLIEKGADVKKYGCYREAVFEASRFLNRTDFDIIPDLCFLLDSGASSTNPKNGYSLLHYAAMYDNCAFAELLVNNYGFKINTVSSDGSTPLMCAAKKGASDVAIFLIKRGADINTRDNCDKTAYDYAIEKGFNELAELIKP
jgi:ankyrin repeat protein